jgi:hypothetical protein
MTLDRTLLCTLRTLRTHRLAETRKDMLRTIRAQRHVLIAHRRRTNMQRANDRTRLMAHVAEFSHHAPAQSRRNTNRSAVAFSRLLRSACACLHWCQSSSGVSWSGNALRNSCCSR